MIATYTPTGGAETYTAYLDVYVIPRVSTTNGANYGTAIDAQLNSGECLYTDTNFANNLEVIRSKIVWVVKKDDDQGNSKIIADSLGKDSDLISITPTASRSNELRIEGKRVSVTCISILMAVMMKTWIMEQQHIHRPLCI